MKFKTTQKAVKAGFNKIYCVGYCDLQNLLTYSEPIAYTAGVYGWNCDIYDLGGGIALSTGYRAFGIRLDKTTITEKVEKLAGEIIGNYSLSYSQKKDALQGLIEMYIK